MSAIPLILLGAAVVVAIVAFVWHPTAAWVKPALLSASVVLAAAAGSAAAPARRPNFGADRPKGLYRFPQRIRIADRFEDDFKHFEARLSKMRSRDERDRERERFQDELHDLVILNDNTECECSSDEMKVKRDLNTYMLDKIERLSPPDGFSMGADGVFY